MFLELVAIIMSALFFLLASFGRRPLQSLFYSSLGLIALASYLFSRGDVIFSCLLLMMSLTIIIILISKCVIYFDLEKEFQSIYRKSITSVIGAVTISFIFGILLIAVNTDPFATTSSYLFNTFEVTSGDLLIMSLVILTLITSLLFSLVIMRGLND